MSQDPNEVGGIIGEILVYSDMYKTDKGIGIGSTVDEVFDAYEDAGAYYTYISGMIWLDTERASGVQFKMNPDDYSEEPDFDSDMTVLDKGKFKDNAKIAEIRII